MTFAERIDNHSPDPWVSEHLSRYVFVAPTVSGKDILDVACGVGLGHNLIEHAGANSLLGIDLALNALAQARGTNLFGTYCQGDAHSLPLAPRKFDVCLSFETVEHLESPEEFLRGIVGAMRQDGCFYLSTPNRLHRKNRSETANPFHVREFDKQTLTQLLQKFFSHVSVLGHIVDPQFGVCPYWNPAPASISEALSPKVLRWKLRRRLPTPLDRPLSRILGGGALLPGPKDFVFTDDVTDAAHSLLAICRGPR